MKCQRKLPYFKKKSEVNKFHEGTVILEYALINSTTVAKGMEIHLGTKFVKKVLFFY